MNAAAQIAEGNFEVAGIHVDTDAIDIVTVTWGYRDLARHAHWIRIEIDDEAPDACYRAVRDLRASLVRRVDWSVARFGWIELPEHGAPALLALSLLTGGVMASVPSEVTLVGVESSEWRNWLLGNAHASDGRVVSWSRRRGIPESWPDGACRAFAVAAACAAGNEEGIQRARAALRAVK
jgi:hypothetical protein